MGQVQVGEKIHSDDILQILSGGQSERCSAARRPERQPRCPDGVLSGRAGPSATDDAFGCRMAAFGMIWNIDYVIHPEG
ncbi:hypothetical protein KAM644c_38760 [Klebsiella quasipneumoniae subsp. quasipneumoniae]|uniref:Uncharacterized protein n=1 Tax=Klebsiella quasipneumoniae subsp. quasipneumoniae TaxID=1667327 RepID=A0AAN2CFE9_9ENTR|nr:hypothetical protein KAM622c_39960 [Klebsiella quasipneumoniae subsp. quasipneumoniae]BDO14810.1 hypothetical protein KAM644c_38760 [Klebsiella quasipneumoniae subsp. quasipneumoniae]BDO20782.1 hypothetical protein KAM645c_38720 [Klebsiella quasipneumoniae subsp. quasipneumoniae]